MRMADLQVLLDKLTDLRRRDHLLRLDPSCKLSKPAHDYMLQTPLEETTLLAFERRCDIQLPEEYREFLLYLGNGGAGPGCEGLRPLDVNVSHSWISRVFPYSDGWCLDSVTESERENDSVGLFGGTIELGCAGCTIWFKLIITGPMRGQIWLHDNCDHYAVWPEGEECPCHYSSPQKLQAAKQKWRRYTFFEWYDKWLTDSLDFLATKGRA